MTQEAQSWLGEDLTWAIKLARLGNDRRAIVPALGKQHPKHGYHSRMYAETAKDRGLAAAAHYAERTADKALKLAQEKGRVMDPHEARVRLVEIRSSVDAEPWTLDRAGARRALEAAFLVAQGCGRVADFGFDLRTHAMRAGQSWRAIQRHRKDLHDLGWMRRNPRDRRGRTSRFTFHNPRTQTGTFNRPWGVMECAGGSLLLAHDAYRPRSLGDEGWYVQHLIGIGARCLRNRPPSSNVCKLTVSALPCPVRRCSDASTSPPSNSGRRTRATPRGCDSSQNATGAGP